MDRPYTTAARIDYAAELNPQQVAAVQAPPGPALVIAGAGSGKTRTLTYRVAYLLENGISPSNILLLTFTNKAAREMLGRVEALLPDRTAGLWGGTFHSVGNRMLRRHAEAAGFRSGFSILDREDQEELVASVIESFGIASKQFPKPGVVADILSFALNTGEDVEKVLKERYPYFSGIEKAIEEIRKAYKDRKQASNALDFDDLLVQPLRLFEREEEIAHYYRSQFQFILVDEYQDTNRLQADFVDILARDHKNLMVVGDDAQSIYSWRGANVQNILQFPQRYPGAGVYRIETNYRSIPEVLDVANAAIAANTRQFDKHLEPVRNSSGVKPALVVLNDSNQQARFVAQQLMQLRERGIEFNQMAVLYRAHFHSMELQMELTRHGVPFSITSGLRFFEQAHVKDVAAFLKFAANPRDEVAFTRMVRLLPGIGRRSAAQLWMAVEKALAKGNPAQAGGGQSAATAPLVSSFCELMMPLKAPAKSRKQWEQLAYTLEEIAPGGHPNPPAKMINSVMEAVYCDYLKANFPNYDSRREDLDTLAGFAGQYSQTVEFLDQLALLSGPDTEFLQRENDSEAVTMSSIHQAKGLEWRVVFLIWMSDGMFPSARCLERNEDIEEERRLFYVALTRAKDELYLSYPLVRTNAGNADKVQHASRFLAEIPRERIQEWQMT